MSRTLLSASVAVAVASTLMLQAWPASAQTAKQPAGGGHADLTSISCVSAGNCAAVGDVLPPGENLAFTISEKNGHWGKAEKVPGTSALPGGDLEATLATVSCSSPGNCSAGGNYLQRSHNTQAFVVTEKRGVWGKAKEVPGTAALNTAGEAFLDLISCRTAGNCTAAGTYSADPDDVDSIWQQVFVVSEKNGTWGRAQAIPGLVKLNVGDEVFMNALSCGGPGNCTVGGEYEGQNGGQAFVVRQQNGVWGKVQTFPAIVAANIGKDASIDSLSCRPSGRCTAVGSYRDSDDHPKLFAMNETGGTWGPILPFPGMSALPGGGAFSADIESLSCPESGDCTVIGSYADQSEVSHPYVVAETAGHWGQAQVLPGLSALGVGNFGSFLGVSCLSAGDCTAAGTYIPDTQTNFGRVFVVSEMNGRWSKAKALPGAVTLSKGNGIFPEALSCGAPGDCVVGGPYVTRRNPRLQEPFLATQKNGTWGKAQVVPGT
ncbi:MAG TPA: hypothetical protein VFI65_15575 [Streptosporangiaceae bacterium]|nr:hypothetical protein [Streptosporangiaceae bacterium]